MQYLFGYYKKQLIILLWFSTLPLGLLYMQGFIIGDPAWMGANSFISVGVLTCAILLFTIELIQLKTTGYEYLLNLINLHDVMTVVLYIICSIHFFWQNELTVYGIYVYDISLLFGFMKLYNNLTAIDEIRDLSTK